MMQIFRVYYNRAKDAPWVWSFDDGKISNETIVKGIHIGPDCYANGQFDATRDNTQEPRAWFNVHCERVDVIEEAAYFS